MSGPSSAAATAPSLRALLLAGARNLLRRSAEDSLDDVAAAPPHPAPIERCSPPRLRLWPRLTIELSGLLATSPPYWYDPRTRTLVVSLWWWFSVPPGDRWQVVCDGVAEHLCVQDPTLDEDALAMRLRTMPNLDTYLVTCGVLRRDKGAWLHDLAASL